MPVSFFALTASLIFSRASSMVLDAADHLTEQNYDAATQAAAAADIVRGYEDVKLGNVDRYRARLTELSIDTTALPTTR